MGKHTEQAIAVLNGLVGDYLKKEGNGLSLDMSLRFAGKRVEPTAAGLRTAYPQATPRAAIFVHGIMCNEDIWAFPDGRDYGSRLREELGITPLYLRYNTGLPIADNGAELDGLLQAVADHYPGPLQELILVGYSMGGLVLRSACHHAGPRENSWLSKVQRAIYLGTPHMGAPAERLGRIAAKVMNTVPEPITQLIGQISDLRSGGMKDLGDADLRTEDRAVTSGRLSLHDRRHPVPLLPSIEHTLIAGSVSVSPQVASLFGDTIVPLTSATATRMIAVEALDIPGERIHVLPGRTHLDLAHDEDAYTFLRTHCQEASHE